MRGFLLLCSDRFHSRLLRRSGGFPDRIKFLGDLLLDGLYGGRLVVAFIGLYGQLQLRQGLQKGALLIAQGGAAGNEIRQILLCHGQLLFGFALLGVQNGDLLRGLCACLDQDRFLFRLRLLHQLGSHLLRRQQRGAHGVLGSAVFLHLFGQHLQLGFQGGIFLV